MIIAITGHRPNKIDNDYSLTSPKWLWIKSEIIKILDRENPTQVISGAALGADTLFMLIGLELKIPILAAVPFEGQDKIWPDSSKNLYNSILNNPLVTKYIVCEGGYAGWKMLKRNEFMVDKCDKLISVFDGTAGGTKRCIDYAIKQNKPIIRINPNDYPGTTKN